MADVSYLPISDYGVIGNLRTAALVGRNGSIDWCCLPSLDSPSVFAALLDHRKGGRFRVAPSKTHGWRQRYIEGTNILETTFQGDWGRLSVKDFMPLRGQLNYADQAEPLPEIHRILSCEEGEAEVALEWSPRFDYARARTRIVATDAGFLASAGQEQLVLLGLPSGDVQIADDGFGPALRAELRIRAGQQIPLVARYGSGRTEFSAEASLNILHETVRAWHEWVHVCEPGDECSFAGSMHGRVVRSALALKLLTHPHTGAIAAAPTTSLPEQIGGVRNWDYRFAWVRDASFVSQALFALGHHGEARDFLRWVERVSKLADEKESRLQILFGLHGETELPEVKLEHLEGYRGSRPVRIGNGAAKQLQLDVYGELINAAYELVRMGGGVDSTLWNFLSAVTDQACAMWRHPDQGIWEVRTEPRHFVHSKVMTWVALDRAIRMAEHYQLPGKLHRWRREREAIREAVLTEGFDPGTGVLCDPLAQRRLMLLTS